MLTKALQAVTAKHGYSIHFNCKFLFFIVDIMELHAPECVIFYPKLAIVPEN